MRFEQTRGGGGGTASACFLCAFGDGPCDVPSVEGTLLRLVERTAGGRTPAILLRCDDGREAAITLPEHARGLVRALAAVPPDRWGGLTLRVHHLRHDPRQAAEVEDGARRALRGSAASVVVLAPDLLLNITDINNAEYCARHYPLRRMAPSPPTAATLRGTIIHQAFKELLKGGGDFRPHLGRALRTSAMDLALRQVSYEEMAADAEPHLDALAGWYGSSRAGLWGGAPDIRAETFLLAPEVGLKGRMDLLLQDATRGDTLLELKTGAVHAALPKREHRWQVHGYQTLLAARRPTDQRRPGATLLYSGTPGQAEPYGIPFTLRELHHVVELRNTLALTHMTGQVPSPPGGNKCLRCSLRRECVRASAMLGWEPPRIEDAPEPVAAADAAWFAELYALLRLEARAQEEEAAQLWRLAPEERRRMGIAQGDLEAVGEPRRTASGEWEYTFRCALTSELREGDSILLSDGDPVSGAVVSGTILRLEEGGLVLWTPERIADPTLIDRYGSETVHDRTVRNLWRWLEVEPRLRALVAGARAPAFENEVEARVEAETWASAGAFNAEQRRAVARALAARDFLLVRGPPGTGKTSVVAEIARRAMARGERVLIAAFTNQAVDNVLRRVLAEGMTDFVRLGHELSVAPELRAYRLAERAAALSSLTPTAALTPPSLLGKGVGGVGSGRAQHAAPLQTSSDGGLGLDPARLREALRTAPLVATTTATWSAERHDAAGEALRFDLAIVDEATQLTLPAILGALRFARRFVLVGDERQLPPLVMSEEAAERGLKRSLFSALMERWGESASVALTQQYRMHPVICAFPSQAFYAGKLVAAGAARTATLDLTLDPADPLASVLDPSRPLVFVDVPPGSREAGHPPKVSPEQARVARHIALALRGAGVPAARIGILAPYRAQVAAIRQELARNGEREVPVDTVDRFQGAEREVVIFSFGGDVGTSPHLRRGLDFLADPNRLNVALTRAQRKLILLGSRRQMASSPLLGALLEYCAELYGGRGGIVTARRG